MRDASLQSYGDHWVLWARHCGAEGFDPVLDCGGNPAALARHAGRVAAYIDARTQAGKGAASAKGARAAIRFAHVARGWKTPTGESCVVLAAKAAKATSPSAQQNEPANPRVMRELMLRARVRSCRGRRLAQLRDIACLALALGYRGFDVVAKSREVLNEQGGVRYIDLRLYDVKGRREVTSVSDADAVMVNLRRSKTSTKPERRLVFAAPIGSRNAVFCPVQAASRILARRRSWRRRETDLICLSPVPSTAEVKKGSVAARVLTVDLLSALVKSAATMAGLTEGKWASHSLKGGAATMLRAAGYSEEYVQWLLRWTDASRALLRYYARPSPELYARFQCETRAARRVYWKQEVTVPRPFPV